MRRICSVVQMFFAAIALAAIGSVVSNIDALSGIGGLMSLAGGIMTISGIYQLRHENQHFAKAVRAFWIYVAATFIAVIVVAALLVRMAESDVSILMLVIVAVALITILVVALRLQYQTYAGFEELREVRGIDYPPRRIMWCFYIAVISMAISILSVAGVVVMMVNGFLSGGEAAFYALMGMLDTLSDILLVVGAVIEAIHLWLMFTYMQAVRAAAEREQPDRWDSMG